MCTDWTTEDKVHLGEELSDVLIYLVRLADRCHVDLPAAAIRKFQLNAEKYPPPGPLPAAAPGHDRESSGSECKDSSSTAEETTPRLRLSCDQKGDDQGFYSCFMMILL